MARKTTRQALADNVRMYRAKLDMTQAALAKKCKVSARLISIVESNARANIELDSLERLAKGLGVSVVDLLSDHGHAAGNLDDEQRKQTLRIAMQLLESLEK